MGAAYSDRCPSHLIMAIYYVNERGEKIDPNAAPPLSKVFTINTDDKGHEAFLKSLQGDAPAGPIRLTPEPTAPTPDTPPEAPRPKRPASPLPAA